MYDNDFMCSFCKKVTKTLMLTMMLPRGRTFASVQEYTSKFSEGQLDLFLSKLATSKWVKNQYFSWNRFVNEDVIGTIVAGGEIEKSVISKYYNPRKLVIV